MQGEWRLDRVGQELDRDENWEPDAFPVDSPAEARLSGERPGSDGVAPSRRRRRRVIVLGLVLVAGAGAAYGLRDLYLPQAQYHSDADAPLIEADAGPTRIQPESPGGLEVPHQDRLVLQQRSNAAPAVQPERVAPAPEEPLPRPDFAATPAPAAGSTSPPLSSPLPPPPAPATTPQPLAAQPDAPVTTAPEVTVAGPGDAAPAMAANGPPAAQATALQLPEPPARPAPAAQAGGLEALIARGSPDEVPPPQDQGGRSDRTGTEAGPQGRSSLTEMIAAAADGTSGGEPAAIEPDPASAAPGPDAAAGVARAAEPDSTATPPAEPPFAAPRPGVRPPASSAGPPSEPPAAPARPGGVAPAPDLAAAAAFPRAQTDSGSGTHRVQLVAVQSEADARSEWQRLQRRYPALIGGLEPVIRQVDLGARGIWYRVMGGSMDQDTAQRLCAALRNAGADCIVRQR